MVAELTAVAEGETKSARATIGIKVTAISSSSSPKKLQRTAGEIQLSISAKSGDNSSIGEPKSTSIAAAISATVQQNERRD